MIINEDFFDEISDDELIETPDDITSQFQHNIIIESTTHDNYSYSNHKDNLRHVNVYFSSLDTLLSTSPIVESYNLFITDKTHSNKIPTDINNLKKLSYDTFLSNQESIKERIKNKETVPEEEKIFNFPILLIEIIFYSKNSGFKSHITKFFKFIQNLVRCAHNNSKNSFTTKVLLDDIIVYESWRNGPGTIPISEYNSLFNITDNESSEKNVHSFGTPPHYQYNGSKHLDIASKKTITDFKPCQLLFSTPDNKLVSQNKIKGVKNIPIGICTEVGVDSNNNHYALFMAINQCSTQFPEKGTTGNESIILCLERDIYQKDRMLPEIHGAQGWKNTQFLYDFANKEIEETGLYDKHWNRGSITNDNKALGIFPALTAVWRYRTRGTERGDWFIPSESEIRYVVKHKKSINKAFDKVTDHFGRYYNSINDFHVWSSNIVADDKIGFTRMLIPTYFYGDYQLTGPENGLNLWPMLKVIDYEAVEGTQTNNSEENEK